jgi:hypothetical protein
MSKIDEHSQVAGYLQDLLAEVAGVRVFRGEASYMASYCEGPNPLGDEGPVVNFPDGTWRWYDPVAGRTIRRKGGFTLTLDLPESAISPFLDEDDFSLASLAGIGGLASLADLLLWVAGELPTGPPRKCSAGDIVRNIYLPVYESETDLQVKDLSDLEWSPPSLSRWIGLAHVADLVRMHVRSHSRYVPLRSPESRLPVEWLAASKVIANYSLIDDLSREDCPGQCIDPKRKDGLLACNDWDAGICESARETIASIRPENELKMGPELRALHVQRRQLSHNPIGFEGADSMLPSCPAAGSVDEIDIILELSPEVSPNYLSILLSSAEGKTLLEAINACVRSADFSALNELPITLPSLDAQTAEWFSLMADTRCVAVEYHRRADHWAGQYRNRSQPDTIEEKARRVRDELSQLRSQKDSFER